MTYDPSMTITSTIPAPEGSDSTSREGKAIPLPVMAGGNASPAPDVPPPDKKKPKSFAVRQYKLYKLAAGVT